MAEFTDQGAAVLAHEDGLRIQRVVTSGTFELDGGSWDVDNNVWLIGDDREVAVVDPAHDAAPILDAVAGRTVVGIWCTHAHNDHITAAGDVREATGAPVFLHPEDRVLWDMTHDWQPDEALADGDELTVAGTSVRVIHTPGHAPGAVCFFVPALGAVLTGDTLFQGGPGATGRSYSDKPTLVASIREKLFTLPGDTVVLTGHGDSTTLAAEEVGLEDE
ncbi:MBL fold metallo-hydrolase [Dermacoccus abyssi]|jgi:glyoxylase-like metal-dependent hydrolase (beta-lactamase superfamily II)|uniref:MBL fold metallo-hydrolase n=1 Tax=Dermacoccus sp. PAMC28757 TaxID=2762331 RepID=UPI00164E0E75|nr:MBL fold metallo-hydrolase [Dermacoccus sp. PAMC28757]QNK53861.1 MBL fold metallo-hydrolase [Dermacoccus sp. PAMC28757]